MEKLMMKIGYVIGGLSEDDLKLASDVGFEALEVRPANKEWLDGDKKAIDQSLALLDKYKIEIYALCVDPFSDFCSLRASKDEIEIGMKRMAKIMDLCKIMGVKVFQNTGPRGYYAKKSMEENIAIYKEIYSPIGDLAESKGVKIAFENCPGGVPFADGETLAITPIVWEMMFEAVPSKYIGLVYDPSHLMWQFIDHVQAASDFRDRIFEVHGKDTKILYDKLAKTGTYGNGWWVDRHPGFGDVKWEEIIKILHEVGYDGGIIIEHSDPYFPGDRRAEGLRVAGDYLRRFI
jgi:sugar phosphate isomerase/epimerase